MTDEQFKKLTKHFDATLDRKLLIFKKELKTELREELKIEFGEEFSDIHSKLDSLKERMQKQESQLDWIVDALDTEESERLAGNTTTDRTLDNHERRIRKLELA